MLSRFLAYSFLTLCALLSTPLAEAQVVSILHHFKDGTTTGDGYNPSCSPVLAADGNFYGLETNGGNMGKLYRTTPAGVTTIVHTFGDGTVASEGYFPISLALGKDGNLYGVTFSGGSFNQGVIFKQIVGGAYSIVYHFGAIASDGHNPSGVIQAADGNLYATTYYGGVNNKGAVVQVIPGTGGKLLHSFGDPNDGAYPQANLTQGLDGALYSTTTGGGTGGGTVFKISTDGATYQVLHSFGSIANDGYGTPSTLVLGSDGDFYGTTYSGGLRDDGIIYRITAAGVMTILYDFGTGSGSYVGLNPGHPYDISSNSVGLMMAADGNFYGVTKTSSPSGTGTLFKMTPQGVVTFLHNFSDGTVANDGKDVYHAPAQGTDGNLYGVTYYGGKINGGTFYKASLGLSSVSVPPVAAGVVGKPFNFQVAASYQPYSHGVYTLPAGLSYSTSSGLISGTPTTAGTSTGTLMTTNAVGVSSVLLPITIAAQVAPAFPLGPDPAAAAQINQPFSYSIVALNQPTSFTASPLPAGLSLNSSTGVISGTPTALGTTSVTISASNAAGSSGNRTLTLTVAATPPTVGQTYAALNSFSGVATGFIPAGPLLQCFDGSLMGITEAGGTLSVGTIFSQSLPGGDISLVHSFGSPVANDGAEGGNGAALSPVMRSTLIQGSDGNFYGTTYQGGRGNKGTVFKITSTGSLTVLHSFSAQNLIPDGYRPNGLVQGPDGNFYGTAPVEFPFGGVIYRITPQGDYTILHTLDGAAEGGNPLGLILGADGNFYGTTSGGGANQSGTAFKITPTGVFSVLASFPTDSVTSIPLPPFANFMQASDGNFYGVAALGTVGTLYRLTPAGTVTNLYRFADGTYPYGSLLQGFDGLLYGTTQHGGGQPDQGTVFQITLAGALTFIHSFDLTDVSYGPTDGLIQGSDGNFYGTAPSGTSGIFTFRAKQKPTLAPVVIGPTSAKVGLRTPSTFRLLIKGAATSWSVTGSIPPGMSLNTSTGVISGYPTALGSFPISLTATNSIGSASASVTLTVVDLPAITSPAAVTLNTVGQSFSYQIAGSFAPTSFGASNLTPWMSFDVVTGIISGTPPGEGTWTVYPTATNFVGTGQLPVVITVKKLDQTITFPPIPGQSTTTTSLALKATVSSGLPITYTVDSGPATVSGSTLTLTGQPGVVTVTASQAGNAGYHAAVSVSESFTVTIPQTITFPALGTKSNGSSFNPGASASSGLPITYTVVSGPATVSGQIVTITSGVGTVTLKASQAGNASYAPAASVSQSFAVSKVAQTITFPVIGNQPYGVLFAPGATASSGLPVTYSVVSGPATISGNKLSFSGLGTVVVRGNQAGNSTYAAAPAATASFSVVRGPQTITLPSVPKKLVTDGPITLQGTSSSGLLVTYKVTGPATLSGNVVTITGAGSVGVGGYQSGNSLYLPAPNVQIKFTVSKLTQKITFPAVGVVHVGQTVALAATSTSGLPITYSVASGSATISGNNVTFTGTGRAKLTANQLGDATYGKALAVSVNVTVK